MSYLWLKKRVNDREKIYDVTFASFCREAKWKKQTHTTVEFFMAKNLSLGTREITQPSGREKKTNFWNFCNLSNFFVKIPSGVPGGPIFMRSSFSRPWGLVAHFITLDLVEILHLVIISIWSPATVWKTMFAWDS